MSCRSMDMVVRWMWTALALLACLGPGCSGPGGGDGDTCEDGPCNARCLAEGHAGGGYCDGDSCACVDPADGDGDVDSDVDTDADSDSDTCTPDCSGRECGPDGCGGTCGPGCGADETCNDRTGRCECEPDCSGRECGPNGCGGTCGSCGADEECTTGGRCECIEDARSDLELDVVYTSMLDSTDGDFFPTYLAHLIASPSFDGGGWHFAVAMITNESTCASYRVTVSAELAGYSTPAERTLEVAPGAVEIVNLDPTLDFVALRSLSASAPGNMAVTLESGGVRVTDDSASVSVLPVDSVIWDIMVAGFNSHELSAVTVMPSADGIDALLGDAAALSMWGFLYGYDSDQRRTESAISVPSGGYMPYLMYLEPGEVLDGTVDAISGGTADIDVMIMADDQFAIWTSGGSATPCFYGPDMVAHGTYSCTPPAEGWYWLVLYNNSLAFSRTVTTTRYVSREELTREHLRVMFEVLHARGMNYTSVASDFFSGMQHVRLPADTLAAATGNCIDGTLVFASALEALGMEPILMYVPGHAFLGVWSGDDSHPDRRVWLLETTMVSAGDFWTAYMTGLGEFIDHATAADLDTIDVRLVRDVGILPIP